MSGLTLFVVWLGCVFTTLILYVGGELVTRFTLQETILLILGGNLILAAVSAPIAYVAYHTGLGFSLLSQATFGRTGGKIVTLIVPVTFTGFFAINTSLVVEAWLRFSGLNSSYAPILVIVVGALMSSSAIFGMKSIIGHSYVSTPMVAALCVFSLMHSVHAPANPHLTTGTLGVADGLALVVGTWILGSVIVVPDILRFAKSATASILAPATGLLIGNSFILIVGALAVAWTGSHDLVESLFRSGFPLLAVIMITVSLWSVNDNGIYSTALALSAISRLSIRNAVLLSAGLGIAIAMFRPHQSTTLFSWLLLLGRTVPALAGVLIGHGLSTLMTPQAIRDGFRPLAFVALFVALGVGAIPIGIPPVNAALAGAISAVVLSRYESGKTLNQGRHTKRISPRDTPRL